MSARAYAPPRDAGDAGGRKLLAASAKREGGQRIDFITEEWLCGWSAERAAEARLFEA